VLVALSPCDEFNDHFAVQALTYICLHGTDAHRHALLVAHCLPLLMEEARRMAGSSDHDAGGSEQELHREGSFVLDLLRALSLLLRTASAMDAESGVAAPSSTKSTRISRAAFVALGEHWHSSVRAK